MRSLNCLIVEDEPIARKIVVDYCSYLPVLNIVAECKNAFEAREILSTQQIDLLILDISMPVLDGISFLKTLKNPPMVIFTTAFKEYAITAFDLSVIDYLVKPFSLDRFIQGVDKVLLYLSLNNSKQIVNNDYVVIKTENKIYNIDKNEILFIEAKGNYTQLILDDKELKPKMTLSNIEKLLPTGFFSRVHRSYIVNKTKINHIEGNRIFVKKYTIPIGKNYKEAFLKNLNVKE